MENDIQVEWTRGKIVVYSRMLLINLSINGSRSQCLRMYVFANLWHFMVQLYNPGKMFLTLFLQQDFVRVQLIIYKWVYGYIKLGNHPSVLGKSFVHVIIYVDKS